MEDSQEKDFKNVLQGDLDVLVKKFVFKNISAIKIPKSSKLHRARYKLAWISAASSSG